MNLSIGIAGLLISLLGLLQALTSQQFDRWTKRFFIVFFSIMAAVGISNLVGQAVGELSGLRYARIFRVSLFWESALPSFLLLLLTIFLLRSSGEEDWRHSGLFRIVAALWLAYLGLLIYTQFSTAIYSISDENVYSRGPLYPVLLIPPALIELVEIVALLRRRKRLSTKQRIAFGIYTFLPLISILVQMFLFGPYTILLGSSIAAVFMLSYILLDQSEHYYQQAQELAQLKVDVMLSQIQPHFLYNTLGAIQSLCRIDPAAAEQAVASFSRYLRGNMDSLTSDKPIPFERELEHTRLYLQLEQLRYEDALQVSYDLECRDFRIPTLTLQPLAENAVRHGVRGNPDGRGRVTISSREKEDCYEITVTDDGPGFDPGRQSGDKSAHVGLTSVKERLRQISGGRLEIESAPGGGTKARIILPKGDEKL